MNETWRFEDEEQPDKALHASFAAEASSSISVESLYPLMSPKGLAPPTTMGVLEESGTIVIFDDSESDRLGLLLTSLSAPPAPGGETLLSLGEAG